MRNKTRIFYFSHWLLFLSLAALLINYISHNNLYNLLALEPNKVLYNFEIWRLFTYAFLPGTFEGILISIFALGFISFYIENEFNRFAFPAILILLICLQGTLMSLFYWKNNTFFSGMEGISLFILTLYMLLEYPLKDRRMNKNAFSSVLFTGLVGILWFVSVLLHHSISNSEPLLSSISSGAFGIISAIAIFAQIRITLYFRQKKIKAPAQPPFPIPEPEELSMAYRHQKEQYGSQKYYDDDGWYPDSEEDYTEDKLNQILDKINERGKESLSPVENKFLRDYSKKLK